MGTSNELPFKNDHFQNKINSLEGKYNELREEMHNIWKLQTQIAVEACKQYAESVEVLFTHVVKREYCPFNSNITYSFFFNNEEKLGYFKQGGDFHMTVFDIDFEAFMQLLSISIEHNIEFTVKQNFATEYISPSRAVRIESGKMKEVGGIDFNDSNLLDKLKELLP